MVTGTSSDAETWKLVYLQLMLAGWATLSSTSGPASPYCSSSTRPCASPGSDRGQQRQRPRRRRRTAVGRGAESRVPALGNPLVIGSKPGTAGLTALLAITFTWREADGHPARPSLVTAQAAVRRRRRPSACQRQPSRPAKPAAMTFASDRSLYASETAGANQLRDDALGRTA